MVSELRADRNLLFATAAIRQFGYGFLSVMLGLHLAAIGLTPETIGGLFTAALAGGAAMTIVLAGSADRVGRRRVLIAGALLMAVAGAAFALSRDPVVLGVAAILGTISPSGKEVGPFLSVEQAMLSEVVPDDRRTPTFASYNLVGTFAGAAGALAVGLPGLLGLDERSASAALLWAYVAVAVLMALLFARLSHGVEADRPSGESTRSGLGLRESRRTVLTLASLFAVDAFAGGFVVQGLVAYWFALRFGFDVGALGAVFFGANALAALSFLAAAPIARRIGLLNTMVFTHLPSNVFLLLVPLMPTPALAVSVYLLRFLLSQLDVPTRQSYTMAVVPANERSAAAGVLSVSRNAATALAPLFAGATLAVPALGIPFLVGGGLKILYDLAVFAVFRGVKPPEEAATRRA